MFIYIYNQICLCICFCVYFVHLVVVVLLFHLFTDLSIQRVICVCPQDTHTHV